MPSKPLTVLSSLSLMRFHSWKVFPAEVCLAGVSVAILLSH